MQQIELREQPQLNYLRYQGKRIMSSVRRTPRLSLGIHSFPGK